MTVALFRERLLDFSFCRIVFIHVLRGRPCGLLQFSTWEAVMIVLASVLSGICAMWPYYYCLVLYVGQWISGECDDCCTGELDRETEFYRQRGLPVPRPVSGLSQYIHCSHMT